jgi:hypothetical protein
MFRAWKRFVRYGLSLVVSCAMTSTTLGLEPQNDFSGDAGPLDRSQTSSPSAVPPLPAEQTQESATRFEQSAPSRRSLSDLSGNERSPFRLSGTWLPSRQVAGQQTELSLSGFQAKLAVPIRFAPDGGSIWLATSGLEYLRIDTGAIFPDSLIAVPDELWKFNVGTMHFRSFDNGWSGGGLFSIGTASDQPFAELRDLTLTTVAFLNIPSGQRDAWNFSLFYSPTSQLPFPIPGAAYVWRPSERFTANIGVPFSLRYQPTEAWTFTADYRPVTAVNLRASRALGDDWRLYARYEILNETYWLAERTNSNNRLYLFDQRAAIGVDRKLPAGFLLDVSAAYVFDRSIFQAESFSGSRTDVLNIDPGAGVSLMLQWSR